MTSWNAVCFAEVQSTCARSPQILIIVNSCVSTYIHGVDLLSHTPPMPPFRCIQFALEVITNLYGSAGVMHGEPAAYNVVEDKSDDDDGAEKGIEQDTHENESGKGMHGSGEGRYSITGKRAHIPALEEHGLRKKVSVSSLEKSSGELEKAGKAHYNASHSPFSRQTG